MTTRTETISFTVGPDTRSPDDAGVTAVDTALAKVGTGELLHLMDPRRINAFSSGGPPTWSVAFVPVGDDQLFVTYGFSDRIDPAREGCGFELSVRVPAKQAGMWPGLFLRGLARYMITSRRELKVGDYMPFPAPLTRMALAPADAAAAPDTRLDAAFFVRDPLLPSVRTPRGEIEIRRAVGIDAAERELMEPWSVAGLARVFAKHSPTLVTDIARPSLARDAAFAAAMRDGSKAEGSQFGFVPVRGVHWEPKGRGFVARFPGGSEARRIEQMMRARLDHGRNLLVHDLDPAQQLAVAFQLGEQVMFAPHDDVLVVTVPPRHPLLSLFAQASDDEIVLDLGS